MKPSAGAAPGGRHRLATGAAMRTLEAHAQGTTSPTASSQGDFRMDDPMAHSVAMRFRGLPTRMLNTRGVSFFNDFQKNYK